MTTTVYCASTADRFAAKLAQHVARLSKEAIERHQRFDLAISGGSLPAILGKALLFSTEKIEYEKWCMFYADERLVPLDHEDSNHRLVMKTLIAPLQVQFPSIQTYAIDTQHLQDANATAALYHSLISEKLEHSAKGIPTFDCILLGMGPDGHTCSLFPNHPDFLNLQKNETSEEWVIGVHESPKPPPVRISLTLRVLNAAHHVTWVVTGDGKKEAVARVLSGTDTELPSSFVHAEENVWFLDTGAASGIVDRSRIELIQ